jgi:hypothetical protein
MDRTHDGRPVHPPGAPIPEGASGFIQCENRGASYSTWLEEEDLTRARLDRLTIEAEAKALRTKAVAEAALRRLGVQYPGGRLSEMRTQYQNVRYATLWPLRQVAHETAAPSMREQPWTVRMLAKEGAK